MKVPKLPKLPKLPISNGAMRKASESADASVKLDRAQLHELVRQTAFRNGVISVIPFIPGADLPLLTFNQMVMVMQIARAYDIPIDKGRAKELVAVAASALGFRTLARYLVSKVPVLGFAMRTAVGYSATLAIGQLAIAYFDAGSKSAGNVAGDGDGDGGQAGYANTDGAEIPDAPTEAAS
jgi:uncharacterized protein (DUF697 family)